MKKRPFILLWVLFLLPTISLAQWIEQSASPSMGLSQLNVRNEDTVFVTGNIPYILKSTNSGTDWDTLSFTNAWSFKIQFINDSIGFIGGIADFITGPTYFKTVDCGLTWQPLNFAAGGGYYFHTLYFVNRDTGFVSNGMALYKTMDGGDSFATVILPDLVHNITAITFINEQVGFIAGWVAINNHTYKNLLFKTTDQGDTWTEVYQDTSVNDNQFTYLGITQIYFSNPQNGYVAGLQGYLLHTTDGGDSWSRISIDEEAVISDLDFVSADTGYAVIYPDLYKTVDKGLNWQKLTTPNGANVMDVEFITSQTGYISGHKFCKTTTGTTKISTVLPGTNLKVFPNPAKNNIQLRYSGLHIQSLQLTDLSGRIIKTFAPESKRLDVSYLASGVYFLQVEAKEGEMTEKVLITSP